MAFESFLPTAEASPATPLMAKPPVISNFAELLCLMFRFLSSVGESKDKDDGNMLESVIQ